MSKKKSKKFNCEKNQIYLEFYDFADERGKIGEYHT